MIRDWCTWCGIYERFSTHRTAVGNVIMVCETCHRRTHVTLGIYR